MFQQLKIENWKQFKEVDITFHPKLTIITGANGSGKSTIVRILARHLGWGYNEIATPKMNTETGVVNFFTRLIPQWLSNVSKLSDLAKLGDKTEKELGNQIGTIIYGNGKSGSLQVPTGSGPSYQVSISGQQNIPGIHIPAHRPPFIYQQVQHIPTKAKTRQEASEQIRNSSINTALSGSNNQSSFVIKEALISWATFGYKSKYVEPSQEAQNAFEGFQEILKKVLPEKLGFQEFSIRNSEVVLVCETGEFLLDACSGGVSAIVDLAWQIFTFQHGKQVGQKSVVVIDEAENHLHANMQRALLPSLIEAFPDIQFIVTTHSPLLVGSVKESTVVALNYAGKQICSTTLDLENKASSASEILRDVLGVPLTLPIWAEKELDETIQHFLALDPTEANLNQLVQELKNKKLDHLVPMTISEFLGKKSGGPIQ